MNIKQVTEAIENEIFQTLGQTWVNPALTLADLLEYRTVLNTKLNPAHCGPVAAMFATISVRVSVGFDDATKTLHFNFDYAYTHANGGANGYRVRKSVKP